MDNIISYRYSAESSEVKNGIQTESAEYRDTSNVKILGFSDTSEISILDMATHPESTRMNEDYSISDLSVYLQRPRIISQTLWTPAGNYANTDNVVVIQPWRLYVANSIEAKADNYAMMRAHALKLEIRINGSQFHYGRLYAGYCPGRTPPVPYADMLLPENLAIQPTNMGTFNTTFPPLKTSMSQWPGVFIDPTTNKPQQLILPFFWPYNYVSLLNDLALNEMGSLYIWVLAPLQHINGGTDSLTVTITASLVDPVLAMPTSKTIYSGESGKGKRIGKAGSGVTTGPKRKGKGGGGKQGAAKDEYAPGQGVLSGPASALASFAGHLEKVPFIGPYATATKIAASSLSSVAKIFGYSRPAKIDDPTPIYYKPFGNMAVTSGCDNVSKLTLDPKQEITIDPVVVGLQEHDEMSFAHIFQRESLICQASWSNSTAAQANLFHIVVHPQTCPQFLDTNHVKFETALSWGSAPFEYWTGSIKYRIQVVASQMHRGRLAFVYEPSGNPSTTLPDLALNFVQIIDITEQRDFTLVAHWGTYKPWLPIDLLVDTWITSGAFTTDTNVRGNSNGTLSCYVLNELASPNTTAAAIRINIFVSAGDDFQVACPSSHNIALASYNSTDLRDGYSGEWYTYKAESFDPTVGKEDTPALDGVDIVLNAPDGHNPDVDNLNLVFFGEQTVSLRSLLKRYCLYRNLVPPSTTQTNTVMWTARHPQFPTMYGFPMFNSGPMGILTDGDDQFNFVRQTWLAYYSFGYLARRGAVRHKYILTTAPNFPLTTWMVSRHTLGTAGTDLYINSISGDTTNGATYSIRTAEALLSRFDMTNNMSGHHKTLSAVNGGIEFEHPWYCPARFIWTTTVNPPLIPGDLISPDYLLHFYLTKDCHDVSIMAPTGAVTIGTSIEQEVAAAEDFSLHYFLAAPVTSLQSIPAGDP